MVMTTKYASLHAWQTQAPTSETAVAPERLTSRSEVLRSLRNQTIRIPDLIPLFRNWETRVNPNLQQLQIDVDDWLESILPASKKLKALKASDFAFFGATWWPCANLERLRIVTYMAIWLFIWDDEIDSAAGSMWEDWEAAQAYRLETIEYVRWSLGLAAEDRKPATENHIIRCFEVVGTAMRQSCTIDQRELIFEEMEAFMQMTEQEQRLRLGNESLLSLEEFWSYRLGASAVFVCLTFNEYALGDVNLPIEIFQDPDMRCIWEQTNIIVATVNDMLSLKKEIASNAVDSVIPILYAQLGSIEAAMDNSMRFVAAMIRIMEEAEQRLLLRYSTESAELQLQLRGFVDGAKHYCTGNLAWSLSTKRYGVGQNGPVVVPLVVPDGIVATD